MKKAIGKSCIVLAVALIFLFRDSIAPYTGGTRQGELSFRAQEFIASQKRTGTSLWNTISMETPQAQVLGSQSIATSCFSLQLPWNVIEHGREDDAGVCTFRGRLSGKPTTLSIHSQAFDQPLTEYPGVMIRIRDTKKYQQARVLVETADVSMFFWDEDSSVLFAKWGNQLRTVALSGGIERERQVHVLVGVMEKMEFQ